MPGIGSSVFALPCSPDEVSCDNVGDTGGGERLSLRRSSTVTPKNSAICWSRISSGVRLPVSQGDHCCGDTFFSIYSENPAAQFLPPPRPGYFFILHARIFRAIVARSSSGIFPMVFARQLESPVGGDHPAACALTQLQIASIFDAVYNSKIRHSLLRDRLL